MCYNNMSLNGGELSMIWAALVAYRKQYDALKDQLHELAQTRQVSDPYRDSLCVLEDRILKSFSAASHPDKLPFAP